MKLKNHLVITLAAGLIVFPISSGEASYPRGADLTKQVHAASLQSKYKFFKAHPTYVIKALLKTKCNVPYGHSWITIEGMGDHLWIKQLRKYETGTGFIQYPVIDYHPAHSQSDSFVLSSAGTPKAWWRKMWGCPYSNSVEDMSWSVRMTTQQLINAGY